MTAGEVVNKVVRFGAAVALARSLDLEDFGLVNVGIAVAGLVLMGTSLGLPEIGARDTAVRPREARELAANVVAGRVAALGVVAAVAILVAATYDASAVSFVLLLVALVLAMATSAEWLLRGLERMGVLAVSTATGGVIVLAGAALVVPAHPSPSLALAMFIAGELCCSALTWWAAKLGRPRPPRLRDLGHLLRRSWPLALSGLIAYSYYANLDTILISLLRSTEEAGLYSAPYRVFLAVNALGTFAAYAFMPMLARGSLSDTDVEEGPVAGLRSALWLLSAVGLAVLGLSQLTGAWILGVMFGDVFESMGTTFVILCIAVPWYVVAYPVGYRLIAVGANRRFLVGAAVAGVGNLALNLALIPPFGPEGAAAATTLALLAASIVWLHYQSAIARSVSPLLGILAAASIGSTVAVLDERLTEPAGITTLALGLLLVILRSRSG